MQLHQRPMAQGGASEHAHGNPLQDGNGPAKKGLRERMEEQRRLRTMGGTEARRVRAQVRGDESSYSKQVSQAPWSHEGHNDYR